MIAVYDDPLGDDMEAASGYFDGPFDWSAIQDNCGFIVSSLRCGIWRWSGM